MRSEEIKKLIADAYMHGVQHGNNGVIPANSDLQEEADDYLCRSEIVAALHSVEAEKEPEWVTCEERLPTEDDGDCCQKIWAFRREDGHACHDFVTWVARMPHLFSHWAPTGLRRPAPPEHKPE